MYATNGLADLLGISAEELNGKSFYYCIQENCLQEAVKCLESAKANDSIAYLRFWFRDPRDEAIDQDETMSDTHSSDDDEGGVHLSNRMATDNRDYRANSDRSPSKSGSSIDGGTFVSPEAQSHPERDSLQENSRSSSGNSTDLGENAADFMFDQRTTAHSSSSETSTSHADQLRCVSSQPEATARRQIELEAVVSCTSDGLVVVLRAARPFLSYSLQPDHQATEQTYTNGLFASPWATQPIIPRPEHPNGVQDQSYHSSFPDPAAAVFSGPPANSFMQSIREVAVFAWALTGINGSMEQYSRGTATGESQPPTGLPVWSPHGAGGVDEGQHNLKGTSPLDSGPGLYRPYGTYNENEGVDAWDSQSRIRHWTGSQQSLLPPAHYDHPPLQRNDDGPSAPSRAWQ
ncbi:hypothetical protein MMC13_007233 [Lambiella insularis]|nr:hypothetical protein [Lambiella insularis]